MNRIWLAMCAVVIGISVSYGAECAWFDWVSLNAKAHAAVRALEPEHRMMEVSDLPYVWEFDRSQDLQMPELPTGCEAVAASTLARMNGIAISKIEMADALPKGSDFVHQFIGSPYSYSGWACAAPCIASTLQGITNRHVVELTGTPLTELPIPCEVWGSIGMTAVGAPARTQDGYKLFHNTHALVLMEVGESSVTVCDPLRGIVDYPLDGFIEIYDQLGRQAVYIEPVNGV